MLKRAGESQSVFLSVRIYQQMLRAYPPQFRGDFGEAMVQVFRDACRDARRKGGPAALLAFWALTAFDYLKTLVEEHARGGTSMSREKFIKLSGWGMIAGSISLLVGLLALSRPEYPSYSTVATPIDRLSNTAGEPLVFLGFVLVSLGLLGMLLRYTQKMGPARLFLGIASLAGLVSAVAVVGSAVDENGPYWWVLLLAIGVQFLALAVFGFISLHSRLMPRWNFLPILALWLPVTMLFSTGLTPGFIPEQVYNLLLMLSMVMFAALGYLLLAKPQPASPASA